MLFGDKAHILFANSTIRDRETGLSWLMHDLNCPDPKQMHYPELAEVLARHKTTEDGVLKMRTEAFAWLEKEIGADYLARGIAIGEERGIAIGEERGIAIGEEKGMRAVARRLLADGVAFERIAQYTALPLEEVRALAEKRAGEP